jgi:hypothetical protein
MSTIHFNQTTTLTPEQYIAGLHYDWSDPDRVVLRTTDSNVWGGSSGYTYTFKRLPHGATDVQVVIVREGKNAKGRFLALVLGTVGKGVLGKAFGNSIKAIEARNNGVAGSMAGVAVRAQS